MELFRLFGTVLIDNKEAIDTLKKTDKQGKDTKLSLDKIADAGAKITGAVAAGTGAVLGGITALANGTAETADKWDKLSLRTGIAVEELQRWGYAAGQSGADITVLETGMKKLSDTMVDAQNGGAAAQSAYEKLGISMSDLATMSPEETFNEVMYALANMEDGALKNSIGNDLLGKSYTELKPLIQSGADGMTDLKNRADELGIVMSEDAVSNGVVFGDTLADVKGSLDGVKNGIMSELMPQLTTMLQWFLDNMPQIKETAGTILGGIGDVIGFIAENSNILIPILGGLLGAFIALKIISVLSGLMAAYTAFTTSATGAQLSLSAAMMANPIGLVVAAIAALIAIGIVLYKNWDTIKAKASALWDGIKTTFDNIKKKISDVMDGAKDIVSKAIEKIKGFFSFEFKWPKLKLPHFSISGKHHIAAATMKIAA
ncbi:MAG: tail tape measure protein core region [Herbinix sp.]|jgi:Flp pilus assembly pilin Flp|nr:tail tape measure protein core region [Herbinix sp.]